MGGLALIIFLIVCCNSILAQPINRKAVLERHTVLQNGYDSLASLTLGNGSFAFTTDFTGLQSFPEAYSAGVPLGTQSEWGWHSFENKAGFDFKETLKEYHFNERSSTYSVQLKEPERAKQAVEWFRQNPHRLQLGNIGFELIKLDGKVAKLEDLRNAHQTLYVYTGQLHSYFELEGVAVDVITYCHSVDDIISIKVRSDLISQGRLKIKINFPYPTGEWKDVGVNRESAGNHRSRSIESKANSGTIAHQIDRIQYYLDYQVDKKLVQSNETPHCFYLSIKDSSPVFTGSFRFRNGVVKPTFSTYEVTRQSSENGWRSFWLSGAAIDFAGSKDPRANELERRIVLSQYLTRAQCAGQYPPQETGLTYNSWYGKPHLEMHWWHGLHFALWGRDSILLEQIKWYREVAPEAYALAKRQGFKGVRWQKMTDPSGKESPSSVGSFLIWQQPHFISLVEQLYRNNPSQALLDRYKDLVFATADFMTSFAFYDQDKSRYILGKGVIAAQERFKPEETFNPSFELVYWHWALSVAQDWRRRLKLKEDTSWAKVIDKLSYPVVEDNKYLFAESAPDSYTNPTYRTDHPSVLGALGMLPKTILIDTAIMKNTFDWIWENWKWDDTWGWDFPMVAMTASRLGMNRMAFEALMMPVKTNTYLKNGHNFQDNRLTIYLPGNGGLLSAIAMMCSEWEKKSGKGAKIFDGEGWVVKWEGFNKVY